MRALFEVSVSTKLRMAHRFTVMYAAPRWQNSGSPSLHEVSWWHHMKGCLEGSRWASKTSPWEKRAVATHFGLVRGHAHALVLFEEMRLERLDTQRVVYGVVYGRMRSMAFPAHRYPRKGWREQKDQRLVVLREHLHASIRPSVVQRRRTWT